MFLDADIHTQRALARYLAHGDREASRWVGQFIDANQQRILPYPGGVNTYRKLCDEVKAKGFEGMQLA